MSARGEYNIGELARDEFGRKVYSIGFGTHSGTVAAASEWDGPMEVKQVRPGLDGSYEALFHRVDGKRWLLPLRDGSGRSGAARREAAAGLSQPLLERAIGVIYRPQSELHSHYFQAELPRQFDEYVWIDETSAVTPLDTAALSGMPETYPFGV
jgi:protein-L-isoaspartate(D-aspartate) O-methyltransferase